MESITARFREIFKRGLYEYAAVELKLPVAEDADVETLRAALADANYVCRDTVDPPLFTAIALTEALEECDEDRVLVRQKGYEIYQNLKRDHSIDHRISIIKGTLPLTELVHLDSKELAPDSVKRRRREEEQKYLKEQVIIPSQGSAPDKYDGDSSTPPLSGVHTPKGETVPIAVPADSREKLVLPGEMPSDPSLCLDLLDNWYQSNWNGLDKYTNLSVPVPYPALVKPTLDRIKQRNELIKQEAAPDDVMT